MSKSSLLIILIIVVVGGLFLVLSRQDNFALETAESEATQTMPVPALGGNTEEIVVEEDKMKEEESSASEPAAEHADSEEIGLTTEDGLTKENQPVEGESFNERTVEMIAKQWSFEPSEVRVKLGEKVRFNITNVDVAHGIAIPALGLRETLPAGQKTTVEFTASKQGSFKFVCSVFCGSGHSGMSGTLIVE
jgi:cytochrome c oxidase subunit II